MFRDTAIDFIRSQSSSLHERIRSIRNDDMITNALITGDHWHDYFSIMEPHIDSLSHSAKILDIGTQYGTIPWVLNNLGYNNVTGTESELVFTDNLYLIDIWDTLSVRNQIFPLTVRPLTPMNLEDKYDFISITCSNIFWMTTKICYSVDDSMIDPRSSHVLRLHDGSLLTTFIPWPLDHWKFFISDIRNYLTANGTALINPHPYPYDSPVYNTIYREECEYLQNFKKGNVTINKENFGYLLVTNS